MNEHGCGSCGAGWGGMNTCHCSAQGCHRTFTSLSAFDKHRGGTHQRRRFCLAPQQVGLVLTSRTYDCWGLETNDERWDDK